MTLSTIYTVEEIAERYGVKRQTILRRLVAKRWPSHKDGRVIYFTADDIAAIDELTRQSPAKPLQLLRKGVR